MCIYYLVQNKIEKMNNYKTFIIIFFIFSFLFINNFIKRADNYEIFTDDYPQEEGDLRLFCIIKVDLVFLNTNVNYFDTYFFSNYIV
jgi:hypothetical protein